MKLKDCIGLLLSIVLIYLILIPTIENFDASNIEGWSVDDVVNRIMELEELSEFTDEQSEEHEFLVMWGDLSSVR